MIGQTKVARKTQTPYMSRKGTDSKYSIDSVYFWLMNETVRPGQYIVNAKKEKVGTIHIDDRQEITAYMRGTKDSCEYLDTTMVDSHEGVSTIKEEKKEMQEAPKLTQIASILQQERSVYTREGMMHGTTSFANVLKLFDETIDNAVKANAAKKLRPREEKRDFIVDPKLKKRRVDKGPNANVPIIIVPAALTSLITMYNAKQLLSQGGFESSTTVQNRGGAKPKQLEFERASGRDIKTNVRYQIVDDVKMINNWDRVVAVFVTGKDWQLKDFPWKSPAEIFANIQGFHCHFSDETIPSKLKAWKVTYLPIVKNMRHADRGTVLKFWNILTTWIAQNSSKHFLEY